MAFLDPNHEPASRLFEDIRYHLTDGFAPRGNDPWRPRFLEDSDAESEMFVVMMYLPSVECDFAVAVRRIKATGEVQVTFDFREDGEPDESMPSALLVNPTDHMVLDMTRLFAEHSRNMRATAQ